MPARHSVRVGDPIIAQPFAEVLGFADVKYRIPGIAHEVNARTLRQAPEKILAQPLDERLGIGEEELLSRRHSGD